MSVYSALAVSAEQLAKIPVKHNEALFSDQTSTIHAVAGNAGSLQIPDLPRSCNPRENACGPHQPARIARITNDFMDAIVW